MSRILITDCSKGLGRAAAIESPESQFRWPAGADAEALPAMRAKLDDTAFDAALRSALRLEW